MKKLRHLTSFFLIFIFGLLSVKNLFSSLNQENHCLEFAHIHRTEISDTHVGLHTHTDQDEGCHEGKSVFSYSLFPAIILEIQPVIYKMNYAIIFILDHNFSSPFLEADRKPPRV